MGLTASSLASALFSEGQQRVLGVIFGQPGRSFYTNELLRLTGAGKGALQRELERLVAAGLVTMVPIGNQKHYQANPSAPIFPELRSLVQKTCGLADVLRQALAELMDRIQFAFVFGSVARGSDTAASDIDVLVVAENLAYGELFTHLATAETHLGRPVNPTLYTPAEWVRKSTEDNHFVARIMGQPKIFLKGGEDDLSFGKSPEGQ